MLEFQALRVSALTDEVATQLKKRLGELDGIEQFSITVERQELRIKFDDAKIDFQPLMKEMAKAGCSLKDIDAALQ